MKKGEQVLTLDLVSGSEKALGYTEGARRWCKPNELGVIIKAHYGHGLCYEVLHSDGTIGFYEPIELIEYHAPHVEIVDMELVRRLTKKDGKSKVERALKLCEEVGELAAAVLSEVNVPGCEYKTLGRDDVLQEVADVLIMANSIIAHYEFTDDEVRAKFLEKCAKWERVVEMKIS